MRQGVRLRSRQRNSFSDTDKRQMHTKGKETVAQESADSRDFGRRSFEDDCEFVGGVSDSQCVVKIGLQPNMKVPGVIYITENLKRLLLEELHHYHKSKGVGFLPALLQLANVASLPGIVGASIGLPDIHSGYGFAIGNVAAFDMDDPEAVVSPGGVGYDINCGVRLIRTNINLKDLRPLQNNIADELYKRIPVGVNSKGKIELDIHKLRRVLSEGMEWAVGEGLAWPEDLEVCEERGRMADAIRSTLSQKAEAKGIPQLGTLGSGNHYVEVQAVEEIYDADAARAMGITEIHQICIMIHSGSRGLGHQVASDAIKIMMARMASEGRILNDEQLACAPISSPEGQDYLAGMAAAMNFAFVNRSVITHHVRNAFAVVFKKTPRDMAMGVVYDVAHNVAKIENHLVDGKMKRLLVHRKGSTRAFPPHHPDLPLAYKDIGQPVLVGGSMGTCSYVMTGTEHGMRETFGSTCHGAGRAHGRKNARDTLDHKVVLADLEAKGITLRMPNPEHVTEEAPSAYKDVNEVVDICHTAGLSKKTFKLYPIVVIKG